MEQQTGTRTASRRGGFVRRALVVSALALVGLVLSPVAAQAATTRSATGQGFAIDPGAAQANAQANALGALNTLAAQAGEVCTGVTYTLTLVYVVPSGGGYVYNATATGSCAPPPPPPAFIVARSATAQGQGSNWAAADANGAQTARTAILAAGVNCTNWTTASTLVWVAPEGVWYITNVTVTAMCVQ